ncbi:PAS domain S-box protein [bacterium]|nr:PAS domain S-box protein [bacterium]
MNKKQFSYIFQIAIIIVLGTVLFQFFQYLNQFSQLTYENYELNSLFDGIMAIISLILSWLLYQKGKDNQGGRFASLSMGFLTMGLLLTFTLLSSDESGLILLHNLANLLVALFFALVWISKIQEYIIKKKWIPGLIASAVIFVGLLEQYGGDKFLKIAEGVNYAIAFPIIHFVSGALFFIGALYFQVEYTRNKKLGDLTISLALLLFGVHSVIFNQSQIWNLEWWVWHTIQLAIYMIMLVYIVRDYIGVRKALNISREKYQRLFENAPDGITQIDSNANIVDCNQGECKLLGYKKDEIIGKNVSAFLSKESVEILNSCLPTLRKEGYFEGEISIVRKDGTIVPIRRTVNAIYDNAGIFIGAIAHSHDITNRKQAEKLERVLFNISAEASREGDLTDLYKAIHLHLNEVFDTTNLFFGIVNEDETEMSFPYFVDEQDLPPEPVKLPQKLISEYVIKTKKPLFLKKQDIIDLANKDLIDLDVSGTISEVWMGAPLLSQGKALGIIVLQSYHNANLYSKSDLDILNFVSEQIAKTIEYRQAITDLQVEKTYLNELFTSSPEALALVTVNSTILQINKKFTALFGYEEEEVFGRNIDDLLVPSEHRKNAEKYTRDVAMGMQLDFEEMRKKKDGTVIHVSVLGSPVNYKGDILAVYAIYRDITDRIKAAEKLKKSERQYRVQSEELAESNSMKKLLLDVIAHDLRNPAGVIKGFAQFGLENDPNNEILAEIDQGVDNLLNIINNATTLSKVTLGDEIEKEELDLVNIINAVIKESSSLLQFEEMSIDMNIKEKLIVNANPIIGEVFRNYISNAIKYSKIGKKIIIDATIENGYVTVNVKDLGTTIDEKDRENVFLRNVQLGKTQGRGLGLAIVSRIAEAHDAEVGVKPNDPIGNVFYIKIPIQKQLTEKKHSNKI